MTGIMTAILTTVLAAAVTGLVVALVLRRQQRDTAEQLRRDVDAQRDASVGAAIDSVVAVAAERLGIHTQAASGDLASSKALIDAQLATMAGELGRVTDLVQRLERDRESQLGALAEQLRSAGEQTAKLSETTASLRQALSSTSARGQWGERMAADVLRLAGFIEGVNYRRQQTIAAGRPDFTFLLPQQRVLHMDVKFPLDNYLRYLDADTDLARERTRVAFLADVRARVEELSRRGYDDGADALDCVLLFIPNEQLYAFLQQADPQLLDHALRQRIVCCSPLTLFAVLAVMRQAVDQFVLEQASDEILAELGTFRQQWTRFGEQLDKLGRGLESADRAYAELVTTRTRQLEKPLDRLEAIRTARGVPVAGEPLPRPRALRDAQGA